MVGKLNVKVAERELLVKETIAGIKSGKYNSAYTVVKDLKINKNTIMNRMKAGKTRAQPKAFQWCVIQITEVSETIRMSIWKAF
jgi:hypothetical protein